MKKIYPLVVITILFILSGSLVLASPSKRKISIVPLPAHVKEKCGKFILNSHTTIAIPADSMAAKWLIFFKARSGNPPVFHYLQVVLLRRMSSH